MRNRAMAIETCGESATRTSSTLAGMCVNTIVFTKPMRWDMRTAISDENAEMIPAPKNSAPNDSIDTLNRPNIHNAKMACVAKPPPKESRLNRADNIKTVLRDSGERAVRDVDVSARGMRGRREYNTSDSKPASP